MAVFGDLSDVRVLSKLTANAKFVFHCAALVGRASYSHSYAVNVEGTRRLAEVAADAEVFRFIHVSSAAVYNAATESGDYTEDMSLIDRDGLPVYSRTKLQAENVLRAVARERGLEYTIVRPSCIYGPRTKSYTLVPIQLIERGLPAVVGTGDGLMDVVFVDDVAAALVLVARFCCSVMN